MPQFAPQPTTQSPTAWQRIVLAASSGASLVGFIQTGASAVLRTLAAKLQDAHVSVNDFNAGTVTQNIDAAITASSGRTIVIPRSVGAGEPTSYPLTNVILDLREASTLAGRKIVPNGSDANGRNVLNILDDQTDPPLSHAALLAGHRPTGTLPSNRNGEGAQIFATSIGTVNNSPVAYILTGAELAASVDSNGGKIPFVWGAHSYVQSGAGKTTDIGEFISHKVIAASHNGAGTVDLMLGLDVENPSGTAATKACARFQGKMLAFGDFALSAGAAGGSNFYSGGATNYYYIDIGRTSGDLRLAVAGAANDFIGGTAQGDAILGANTAAKTLWLLANGAGYAKLSSTAFSLVSKLYPPQDTAAFQTACGLYAGFGAPNNANGTNGDIYFRSDGGALTTMYQRRGGAWVGII